MSLIYINTPESGLGDRLLDIITLYTYSQFKKYNNFLVYWGYNSSFDKYRQCLKLKHLLNYIQFPENIKFYETRNELYNIYNKDTDVLFEDILGACSLKSFCEKYIDNENIPEFEKMYFSNFQKIKMNNIPTNIKTAFDKPVTTIHLRRCDKINNGETAHGVIDQEINKLEIKTVNFIDRELLNGNTICFVSDDKSVKHQYINKFKDKGNIIFFDNDELDMVKQVYYDFFCLCYSDKIFMSQKFSTFSITSSLINKQKLLFYPFGYGRLYDKYNFNKYPNFIYFCEYKKEWEYFPKNIIENKKIHMITYGDDFFDNAKKTLIKEAIDSKFFYSIKAYSGKDLDDDFKIKYKHVLEKKRGGGYFIWRGYVIQQKLKELNNGDFLIFNDAGNTINKKGDKRLLEYINMLDKSNYGLLWFRTVYKEKRWTFKQTFDYFSIPLESNIGNSGQHWVGGLIFQKNSHSMKLLNLYLKTLNDNSLLFTDYYHDKQSHDFVENRHDQSVLSIISKIHGCISIPPSNGAAFECATPFHFSWPILCTHRRNGVDNHSYSKNYDGGKLHSK